VQIRSLCLVMMQCIDRCKQKKGVIKMTESPKCGCGRSPTGKCIGWHALSEEEYQEKKTAYEARQAQKS
jgi:hypothetical protein